ncbi:hypothetical protein D3C79_743030 [compost metagenome]
MTWQIESGFGDISKRMSRASQVTPSTTWMCLQQDLITIVLWLIRILKICLIATM